MFPITTVFDCLEEEVIDFWYSDNLALAREKEIEFRAKYPDVDRYEIVTEYTATPASHSYSHSCTNGSVYHD